MINRYWLEMPVLFYAFGLIQQMGLRYNVCRLSVYLYVLRWWHSAWLCCITNAASKFRTTLFKDCTSGDLGAYKTKAACLWEKFVQWKMQDGMMDVISALQNHLLDEIGNQSVCDFLLFQQHSCQ